MTRRTVLAIAQIVGWAAVIGAIVGLIRSPADAYLYHTLTGALIGFAIGLGCSVSDFVFFHPRRQLMRDRLPVFWVVALRAVNYSMFIIVGLAIPSFLLDSPPPWADADFPEAFAISALIAFSISMGVEITSFLGKEATVALFTGRYMRPRLESRAVLFADIVGSTSLAEQIGELQFHRFLSEVASDLSVPIDVWRGEIHKYVGDAIIVTWPTAMGLTDAACLRCAIEMQQTLDDRVSDYRSEFGHAAKLRIAVHCGPVAAGEIGVWKKEIAFLGDTMNTASRIEEATRHFGETIVVSDAVVSQLSEHGRPPLRHLPMYAAAGKQYGLGLWALER